MASRKGANPSRRVRSRMMSAYWFTPRSVPVSEAEPTIMGTPSSAHLRVDHGQPEGGQSEPAREVPDDVGVLVHAPVGAGVGGRADDHGDAELGAPPSRSWPAGRGPIRAGA